MSNDKADGWVAWNSEYGLDYSRFGPDGEALLSELWNLLCKDPSENGWRIRPVKLQFLDEPKSDLKFVGDKT